MVVPQTSQVLRQIRHPGVVELIEIVPVHLTRAAPHEPLKPGPQLLRAVLIIEIEHMLVRRDQRDGDSEFIPTL